MTQPIAHVIGEPRLWQNWRKQASKLYWLKQSALYGKKKIYIHVIQDPELIERNIQMKLKSPDYTNLSPEEALLDFRKRMALYEEKYQMLDPERDSKFSYIKVPLSLKSS